jgi:hypothetical protein
MWNDWKIEKNKKEAIAWKLLQGQVYFRELWQPAWDFMALWKTKLTKDRKF